MKPENYFCLERPEMVPFVPASRERALEVGCGEGRFLGGLVGIKESWGIEPSCAAVAAGARLTKVIRGTFADVEPELPRNYFDLIICNDVIEHMADYSGFLHSIRNHIAPGGMFIGSIPNVRFYKNMFEFLFEKDWYYTDSGILDRTHLAFFTLKSWQRTLKQHGFTIIQLKGINTDLRYSTSIRAWTYLILARLLSVGTFGYFSDIRHLQFAFQAILAK